MFYFLAIIVLLVIAIFTRRYYIRKTEEYQHPLLRYGVQGLQERIGIRLMHEIHGITYDPEYERRQERRRNRPQFQVRIDENRNFEFT